MSNKTESTEDQLFLLEVLVDQVVLEQTLCLDGKVRTNVVVECLNKESLEICDDESVNSPTAKTHVRRFNCGKSCLFTMKLADIKRAIEYFPIKVTVMTMLPCGCLPTKIIGGTAQIDMTKEFVQAYRTFVQDPTVVSYQAMKDTFRLINQNEPSGTITMFIRISCFGHHITTSFTGEVGGAGRSDMMGGQLFDRMCNPPHSFDPKSLPCSCAQTGGEGICGVNTNCPFMKDKYNVMPCVKDDICSCGLPASEHPNKAVCASGNIRGPKIPPDCCPRGNKVAFKMPMDPCTIGHKQRMNFKSTDGMGEISRDESFGDNTGMVYDFKKSVIRLRVGKTVEMAGQKSKLEYQFITPVPTNEKHAITADDSTAQCNFPECCCCCRN